RHTGVPAPRAHPCRVVQIPEFGCRRWHSDPVPLVPTTRRPRMALLTALDRRHTIAPSTYNRWLIPPAALAVHLCIGQVYATSVYKTSMVSHFGASQTAIGFIFSIAIVALGLSA